MKTVKELTREQLIELKQNYLTQMIEFPSWGALEDVDQIISDGEIFNEYEGTVFFDDDFSCSCKTISSKSIETYVMEGSKGKFLHINATEDGNGTWFDWTPSIWEAYQNDLKQLKEIALGEFSNFDKGYPKFHKVRFTCEKIETVKED